MVKSSSPLDRRRQTTRKLCQYIQKLVWDQPLPTREIFSALEKLGYSYGYRSVYNILEKMVEFGYLTQSRSRSPKMWICNMEKII